MKIKNLPKDIQEIVFLRQEEQGNKPDANLDLCADRGNKNFNWNRTIEKYEIWDKVYHGIFNEFYEFHKKENSFFNFNFY